MLQSLASWFMTAISIATAFSVFMHDGHLDKAMITSSDAPLDAAHIARSGHAHADVNAVDNLLNKSFAYQAPSSPPKSRSDRKRRLTLPPEYGRHAFDDILMPFLT